MYYSVGHGPSFIIPEHRPEEGVYVTEDFRNAAEFALSLVDSFCDGLTEKYGEFPEGETPDDILAHAAASLRDEFYPRPDLGWRFYAEDPNGTHDLGISFWINASEEAPEGHGEDF